MYNYFGDKMKKELLQKIILFVLFFVCIFVFMSIQEVNEGDELINFLNVLKMSNGEKIYEEAIVITTPLFHFIGLIFMKIFR